MFGFFNRVNKVIWPLKSRISSADALLICPRIIVSCVNIASACKEVKRDLSSNTNAHACILFLA